MAPVARGQIKGGGYTAAASLCLSSSFGLRVSVIEDCIHISLILYIIANSFFLII